VIQQKLRKVGNSYVVTIPRSEVERQQLKEGQLVAVAVQALEVVPVMPADVQNAWDASWQRNEPGYRYLAGR